MKPIAWKAIPPLLLGIIIALLPAPPGLAQNAWYFLAIFATVIFALILEPIPAAAVGFAGVFAVAVLGLAGPKAADSIRWALSGFSNTTVWLIFGAFMFAMGYEKTGLGKRIALHLVRILGKKTLGLGYAITFADLILAPFTPSNTARSAGTIFPIIQNLPGLYGSAPGETARKIGSYIMWTALAATCVTSSMFITSLAPNPLAVELVDKTVGIRFSWTEWFIGFLPVGITLLLILPYLIYKIYPPEVLESPEIPSWASQELVKMGKPTRREMVMAILAILALTLWIFGTSIMDAATVAGLIITLMLLTGIVSWDDVLGNKPAWNVLVWFATLVAMADGLNKVGFVAWFTRTASDHLTGMSPLLVMVILVAIYFFVHYMFASLTAHTTAVLVVVLAAGAAVPGIPVKTFALLLCYSQGIMGIITPYATGPSPAYYGSGYISRKDFWTLGLIFGVIFFVALLGIGVPYLTAIGY
ncbi:MAG: DASS family sodium-coupled anion symporter [Syntrophobacteraceae bacterium]|jgi:L-tartrate/succinate antiporter